MSFALLTNFINNFLITFGKIDWENYYNVDYYKYTQYNHRFKRAQNLK